MTAADWDATTYDVHADAQEEWARGLVERLDLNGDERVLDAGCGSGRPTKLLLERLPHGHVVGVDASPSMIEYAREALDLDRVTLITANLLDLELDERVDAVFSNATLHWVLDHDRLFVRLHDALRPGGQIEAQCGGQGNIAEVENVVRSLEGDERFAPYLRTLTPSWYFAGVADTITRLERAGFERTEVWTNDSAVTPEDPRAFLSTSVVVRHLDHLPEHLREPFLDALIEYLPRPLTLNYVRLNISARRHAQ